MAEFWCLVCERYTSPDEEHLNPPLCSNCGEGYACSDCGFEIDAAGNCQRSTAGPPEVVGICGKERT